MANKGNILLLGALAMDVTLLAQALPEDDGFALIDGEKTVPGGSAANVAVAVEHLGAQARLTGKIGDDDLGRQYLADLNKENIDTACLRIKNGGVTMHTYVIVAPQGRHCILANLGDCINEMTAAETEDAFLDDCACFYSDMFSAPAALQLAELANKRNIPVVYNLQCTPAFMANCGCTFPMIDEMLSRADLILGGRSSLSQLAESSDPAEMTETICRRWQPRDGVICSLGSEGSLWRHDEGALRMPAYKVQTVDSTGAGDCFAGALMVSLYANGEKDREKALRFASAAAALTCREVSPRFSGTAEDVHDLIASGNKCDKKV